MFTTKNLIKNEIGVKPKIKNLCYIGVTKLMVETPSVDINDIVKDGIISSLKNVLGLNERDNKFLAKAYGTETQAEEHVLDRIKNFNTVFSNINRKFVATGNKTDLPKEAYWMLILDSNPEHVNQLIQEAKLAKQNGDSDVLAKNINAIVEKVIAATEPSGVMIVRDRSQGLDPLSERVMPKF